MGLLTLINDGGKMEKRVSSVYNFRFQAHHPWARLARRGDSPTTGIGLTCLWTDPTPPPTIRFPDSQQGRAADPDSISCNY